MPANLALLLLSGALTAALFRSCSSSWTGGGWTPPVAGVVVTVMPVAAIVTGSIASRLGHGHACRDRRHPRLRRAYGARRAPRLGVVVDGGAADPGRRRPGPRALRLDGARAPRSLPAGRPRRLDDRGAPCRRRPGAAASDTGVHHGPRPQRGAGAPRRRGRSPGQPIPPLEKLAVAQDVLAIVRASNREVPDVRGAFADRLTRRSTSGSRTPSSRSSTAP